MRAFIWCPSSVRTGGPTALQQLHDQLRANGVDALLVDPQPAFTRFGLRAYEDWHTYVGHPTMGEGDIVVAPEKWAWQLAALKGRRRLLWWLSVDNAYPPSLPRRDWLFDRLGDGPLFRGVTTAMEGPLRARLRTEDMKHAAQSEYAAHHLQARLGVAPLMLTDYIEPVYATNVEEGRSREPFVLYNPAKGQAATRRLIDAMPDHVHFVPLEGLTADGARSLMSRASVYVDLGSHPGRDRLPREAALLGCTIVVGDRGAAAFEGDMPLPAGLRVKTPSKRTSPAAVATLILDLLEDPALAAEDMTAYRAWIRQQQDAFEQEAACLAALLQSTAPGQE